MKEEPKDFDEGDGAVGEGEEGEDGDGVGQVGVGDDIGDGDDDDVGHGVWQVSATSIMVFTTFIEVITVVMVWCSRMTLAIMMGATLVRRVMASMDRWVLFSIELVGISNDSLSDKWEIYVYKNTQDGDYQEGDVDQEGMDIEYFSQYKVGSRCLWNMKHN